MFSLVLIIVNDRFDLLREEVCDDAEHGDRD